MKRMLLCLSLLVWPLSGHTQTTPDTSVWDDQLTKFYLVAGFIFVVSVLVLIVLLYLLSVIKVLAEKAARERAEKLGITFKPEPSFWSKLWIKINGFVPEEKEATLVLDHNYDGIKELDNHLPPWWKGLFYVTIIFAVVYMVAYHVLNSLPLSKGEYENEIAYASAEMQKIKVANPGPKIDETTVEA